MIGLLRAIAEETVRRQVLVALLVGAATTAGELLAERLIDRLLPPDPDATT